tara:strand:+ start:126 stop:2411 length:2286 start_codon:yes stop_codon:yes gene_type:complete
MKKKLLKSRLKELIRLNEQNVNNVPQVNEQDENNVPQVLEFDEFNFLVPYNFSGYSGPNLTTHYDGTEWVLGSGQGGVGDSSGPTDDCDLKTDIGVLSGEFDTWYSTTAISGGEAGSVFFQILEYLWNLGDFNKDISEIMYQTTSITFGFLDSEDGFLGSTSFWPDLGSIGLCYNVDNQTAYYYQLSKYFVIPGGPSFLIRSVQDALDAIQEVGGPNLDVNLFESFSDFVQAVEAFQITCASGGCAGKCYCCCRNNGCLEGADEYIVGCTDEEAGMYPDINGNSSLGTPCEYPCVAISADGNTEINVGYFATNYNPDATYNPGSIGGEDECIYSGCTDPNADNFEPQATIDDGSCYIEGCTETGASNYNPNATTDDGSCQYLGCTDELADNFDPTADTNDGSCEYLGCTNNLASNYDPDANVDDGSCEFEGFICPPDDSLAADGCVGVNVEPGTMYPLEAGPDGNIISETLVYATKAECDREEGCLRKEGGEKLLCWKCTDKYPYQPITITVIAESSPLFEQDEKGRMARKKKPTKIKDDEKVGCPGKEGYQVAPVPFWTWEGGPYDTMQGGKNNPCSGPERPDDRPFGPDPDPNPGCTDPTAFNYDPSATEDDGSCEYVNVGGPWFCPADAGNFPWPTCCVQTGIVYSNVMNPALGPAFEEFYNAYSGYPQIEFGSGAGGINGVNYFTNPIGQTYSNNEACNTNSGCAENISPSGVGNCAGTYSPPIDDDSFEFGAPTQLTPSRLRERLIKLAGVKKPKK